MVEETILRNLKAQKLHFLVGTGFSLVLVVLIVINAFDFWLWQAGIVDVLLSFAGVPHSFFPFAGLNLIGPTFQIPLYYKPISSSMVICLVVTLLSIVIPVNFLKKIAPPLKAGLSIVFLLSISTLIWNTFVSPVPAYNVHWITIDWSCSGVISIFLITIIFMPFIFTIRGPLWIKVFWFIMALGFSLLWNLIRLSFVTATLYYFGGTVFLLSHYLIGAFVDFLYIITFYSLALSHLSKHDSDLMEENYN
jgi:exosortase/archaeosortase family protein